MTDVASIPPCYSNGAADHEDGLVVLWHGDLLGIKYNLTEAIHNLRFTLPQSREQSERERVTIPNRALNYLTEVDPHRVPLHLAAGPSMIVSGDSAEALAPLTTMLGVVPPLDREDEPFNDANGLDDITQSKTSMLFKVDWFENDHRSSNTARVTEILIYGIQLTKYHNKSSMARTTSTIYALPLSSDFLYQVSIPQEPEIELSLGEQTRPEGPHPQKGRLDNLFDLASDNRRKSRQRISQSISQAAASSSPALACIAFDNKRIKLEDEEDDSISAKERGNRIQSTLNDHTPQASNPVIQPMSFSEQFEDTSVESRNRQTISRTVMAGMRLYGLQQRARPSVKQNQNTNKLDHNPKDDSHVAHAADAATQAKDTEYKAIYHQLFKATAFALRHRIESEILPPDAVRDIVDRLLTIFCAATS